MVTDGSMVTFITTCIPWTLGVSYVIVYVIELWISNLADMYNVKGKGMFLFKKWDYGHTYYIANEKLVTAVLHGGEFGRTKRQVCLG